MTKKILLIIGILVIVAAAAYLVYFSGAPAGEGESRVGFSIREFLPFGRSDDTQTEEETSDGSQEDVVVEEEEENAYAPEDEGVLRLRKISGESIAGAVIFNLGKVSLVRFVEKGTGNVYEARSDVSAVTRLTNTTIPKIVRAYWLPDGSGFLAQTLQEESEIIETSFVKLKKNTSTATEDLTPFATTIGKLPTGIKEITIKPDGTKIFYYTVSDTSTWYVSNPDGTGQNKVFTHPLIEWIPKWISANTVMLQNKSSSESVSYVYSFDVAGKTLRKTGVGAQGLSFNPNNTGALSLISSGGTVPQLYIVDNKNASAEKIMAYSFAEKCVWLKDKNPSVYCAIPREIPKGNYPDIWYKGLVSTEDSIEKIRVNDNTFFNISNLSSESKEKIDAVDLGLSPDETHLIFRNKIDGYLWMLRVEE